MTALHRLDTTLDPASSGRKAATLGRLRVAGFDVPDGFVVDGAVTTEDQLAAALAQLGGSTFAVRSSGLDEDGPASSMAGAYLSLLSVSADDVALAIRECRESAGDAGEKLPVLVQRMVDAKAAGAAFTADPVNGDRSCVVLDATPGLGDRLMTGAVDGEEWEITGRHVRLRRGTEPVLTRRRVRAIARLARRIESELDGGPLDIEWAWDGRTIWVVQARPITGIPPEVSWDIEQGGVFHRGFRLGEWIPEPVTPLFESWLLTTLERRMHEIHREQIGQLAPEPHHVVVNGWYFYSLNFLPVPGGSLLRSLPRVLRLSLTTPRRVAVMFPQSVIAGYPLYERDWREDLEPRYRRAVEDAVRGLPGATVSELIEIVDRLGRLAGEYFASIAVVAGSAYKVETLLAQFWNRHLREELGGSHLDLLGGLDEVAVELDGPLIASLDWYVPPVTSTGGEPTDAGAKKRRVSAEAAARAALAHSKRRTRRFERLLAHAQHLQPLREAQSRGLASAWPVMRRAVESIGEELARSGRLRAADDVFFLDRSELTYALGGKQIDDRLVGDRRSERAGSKRLVAPAWVGRMPIMTRLAFEITNKAFGAGRARHAIVSGVPASAGTATGPVRVLLEPSDFGSMQDGEVIVAPLTAPAWTPLFGRAAAVITDVGSGLAHASIIAREFGIPAVVGCGDATKRLRNGQVVTVNGSDGTVSAVRT